jgi:hypothetical protein
VQQGARAGSGEIGKETVQSIEEDLGLGMSKGGVEKWRGGLTVCKAVKLLDRLTLEVFIG